MALVKVSEKGAPIVPAEYDAVVTQVEENQSKAASLEGQINNTEAVFSVASEAAMTAKWTELDTAGKTPIDGRELFRSDLNQFWKWDSAATEKGVFSRDNLEMAVEIAKGNTGVAVSGDVADAIETIETKNRTSILEEENVSTSDFAWVNNKVFSIPANTDYSGKYFGFNLTNTNKNTYLRVVSSYNHTGTLRKSGSTIQALNWNARVDGLYELIYSADFTDAINVTLNFTDATLHNEIVTVYFEELSIYESIKIEDKLTDTNLTLDARTLNYPLVASARPNKTSSKLSLNEVRDFYDDLEIYNEKEVGKRYSVSSVQRNFSGVWKIRVAKTDADGFSNITDVLEFTTDSSPENGNNTTAHELKSFNNSTLKGQIKVNWSKIADNSNYFSMTPVLGYELDLKIFKGYEVNYTSTSLKQIDRVLEEGNYLIAEQVDKILSPFYLKGFDSSLSYGLYLVKKNYDDGNNNNTEVANAIEIFSIDNSDVIELVAFFRTNDVVNGVKKIELVEANNSGLSGELIVNWDEIPEAKKFLLGTTARAKGYVFRESFYTNKTNDLTVQVDNFDTVYEAVQRAEKGRINVGLTTLNSFKNATTPEDFLNVNCLKKVSNLYDFSYVDTKRCRLMLIDSNKLMWWRVATNQGVQVYTSTIADFENTLVDDADVNGEKRKSIEAHVDGNVPTYFNLVETAASYGGNANTVNVTSMRESEGNFVFQDFIDADYTTYPNPDNDPAFQGKIYFFNKSTNKIEESTTPTGGRKGYSISAWGFDFYKNICVTIGYFNNQNPSATITRGKGRLLVSHDYGQTFRAIFDVETTNLLSDVGFPNPEDETQREMTHIHGCCIDRFQKDLRIYMTLGDFSPYMTDNAKVYYTDNHEITNPTWVKMPIDITETVNANEQHCSVFATKENILFGTDMRKNAIVRMNKVNDSYSKREVAELVSTDESGVAYIPGSFSQFNNNEPIFIFNMCGDLGGVPSNIYATFDGVKFYKIWQDTVNHSPFFNRQSVVFGVDGKLFSLMQEGSNNRFTHGMTLLWGEYKVY